MSVPRDQQMEEGETVSTRPYKEVRDAASETWGDDVKALRAAYARMLQLDTAPETPVEEQAE